MFLLRRPCRLLLLAERPLLPQIKFAPRFCCPAEKAVVLGIKSRGGLDLCIVLKPTEAQSIPYGSG